MASQIQLPGISTTPHWFQVPLNHANPDGEKITVFAREVFSNVNRDAELPYLLFLQGGPGHPSPRPEGLTGWLGVALQHFRVLLLDDRGTGRSTPVTFQTMARFDNPEAQAKYLGHFRADAIVSDAELIRKQLLGEEVPWTVLGQSYGGFCIGTYLSMAPEGLAGAIITAGLPPIGVSVDDVYRATYRRVIEQNQTLLSTLPC